MSTLSELELSDPSEELFSFVEILKTCAADKETTRYLRALNMIQLLTSRCPGLGDTPSECCFQVRSILEALPEGSEVVCETDIPAMVDEEIVVT